MEWFWGGISVFNLLILVYFLLLNGSYILLAVLALKELHRHRSRMKSVDVVELSTQAGAIAVTLIAPAYNEESTAVESVRSLLTLEYQAYEILVVNDGSRDATLDRLREAYDLEEVPRAPLARLPTARIRGVLRSRIHDNLWVIDKENGGKADALNAGLSYCQTPLFCAMDADSLLERDALARVVRPFLEDARTVAVGGMLRVANGCTLRHGQVTEIGLPRNLLAQFQVMEYLRAFLAGRMGWDALNASLIISGAFGVFRRAEAVEVGGYATDTVGEDMELVVRLHRYLRERGRPYRIGFVPDPVAWTEVPEGFRSLGRQRDRWQRGLLQSLFRHRVMLLNPRYGRVGTVAYPYFFFLEGLGPLLEIVGYGSVLLAVLAGRVSFAFISAFLGVAVLLGVVLSVLAVVMEELNFRRYPRFGQIAWLFVIALLENLGYRQLNAWWRFRGTISAVRRKAGWGEMKRKGFRVQG